MSSRGSALDHSNRTVLVTGSAGRIGGFVCAELRSRGYRVRGFDLVPTEGVDEDQPGDLTDAGSVDRAVAGCDSVVHLAATPDEADFLEKLLPNNIVGLYHLCQAARRHEVRRLVLTSSVQVIWSHEEIGKRPIRADEAPRPCNHYALTKLLAEEAGEMYCRLYGMSIIVIRPGYVPRHASAAEQLDADVFLQRIYLSPRDAGRAFALAVEAEGVKFAVIPAQSRGPGFEVMDLAAAREVTGYEPTESWPDGRELLE